MIKVHWRTGALLLPTLVAGLILLACCLAIEMEHGRSLAQFEAIGRKLDAAQDLDAAVVRYNLRVAQVLHQGRDQQADLRTARLDMERRFVRLAQETRDQVAAAAGGPETRALLRDVENARRMLELYHAIDLSASRAFVLARDGHPAAALTTYERDVDFRLTTEFSALLDDTLAGERQRFAEAAARNGQRGAQRLILAGLTAILLAALLLSWTLLTRRAVARHAGLEDAFERRTEELRNANHRLRETDARRAQFLADVSHELRTPLTILRGEADVALLPGSQLEDQRRSLERIQDQASELGQLLNDLIAFARSDAEPQSLALSRILLDDVLAAAVEEGETLAEPREVTVSLTLSDKSQWVDADMRRLKQALIIGLDNAINHSPPGSRIEVTLTRLPGSIRTSILDRGPGVSDGDQQRVFDRFYRGPGASHSFGLGIGLAIARGIIEQHNGQITLANRADGGAILAIDLPHPKEARA
ncbi:sensor histidine kinase [Devosia sp. A449]